MKTFLLFRVQNRKFRVIFRMSRFEERADRATEPETRDPRREEGVWEEDGESL